MAPSDVRDGLQRRARDAARDEPTGTSSPARPGGDAPTLEVGVLAMQGDFDAHARAVAALGHRAREVRGAEALQGCDALLLPGGESTTMLKLILEAGLRDPLVRFCRSGAPVLGTCAGAILLARAVDRGGGTGQPGLGLLDIAVERNAYGRQLDSFVATADEVLDPVLAAGGPLELVFIRAPVIRAVGPGVEVLVRHGGHPVAVRSGPVFATTFHPELTRDARVLARVLGA